MESRKWNRSGIKQRYGVDHGVLLGPSTKSQLADESLDHLPIYSSTKPQTFFFPFFLSFFLLFLLLLLLSTVLTIAAFLCSHTDSQGLTVPARPSIANEKFGVISTQSYPLRLLVDCGSSGNCPQGPGVEAPAPGIRKLGASAQT
jgi:hypothetical protein